MSDLDESISLCVLLWAHPVRVDELVAYEDDVLRLLADHGAVLLSRVRTVEPSDTAPTEIQVIRFGSQRGFDAYMADPRRVAMTERRDAAVARTEVHTVAVVQGGYRD